MKFNLLTKVYMLGSICLLILALSCKKKSIESDIFIKKQWKVDLSASNITPVLSGRSDHAVAVLYLMDNNELDYYVYFDQVLQNGDIPTSIKVNLGPSGTNGSLLIDLQNPVFDANRESKGKLNLNTSTIDSLLSQPTYLLVLSSQQGNGLVRGQINN
ncbi:MAG: hypothetical protein JWR38_3435 [Mucilaginibacter sp.]|nr:hypothetical protein [Mucilaginibacter sp.]